MGDFSPKNEDLAEKLPQTFAVIIYIYTKGILLQKNFFAYRRRTTQALLYSYAKPTSSRVVSHR